MNETTSTSNTTAQFQGWTSSPNSRGSIDIIWSCLITLIFCSWSAVCVNIPARGDSTFKKLQRKAWLTWICIIGPEYLLVIALGQWSEAKQSVQEFHEKAYHKWTMKHAFYTQMGGFLAVTTDKTTFPLRSKSLLYLIRCGLIADDVVTNKILVDVSVVEDRNKADRLFRIVTLAQATWFCINVLARFVQHLPVTTLELTVLGFFIPTATTYLLWWEKPCDVDTAELIPLLATTNDLSAGREDWYRTPLDFLDRKEWHGSLLYRYWLRMLHAIIPFGRQRLERRQAEKRRSDNDLVPVDFWHGAIFEALPSLPFILMNFVAYNHHFPTTIERTLWRVASITMVVTFCGGAAIEAFFGYLRPAENEQADMRRRRAELGQLEAQQSPVSHCRDPPSRLGHVAQISGQPTSQKLKLFWKRFLKNLRNNTAQDDPHSDVPLRMLLPGTLAASLYCMSRLYILIEDCIAFRHMPLRTFETVNWNTFLPHFG